MTSSKFTLHQPIILTLAFTLAHLMAGDAAKLRGTAIRRKLATYDCASFASDGNTINYSAIAKEDTSNAANNVPKNMYVGGSLSNSGQTTVSISGHVYYGSIADPINTNFNGGKTQLSDMASPPLDFEYYEWLAANIEAGQYDDGYEVIIETQPKGPCYDMYDFLASGSQGSNNGKTLIVFTFEDDICLTKTQDGRQFGPSVMAPFAKVTLTDAGFLDGVVIAKEFATDSSGLNGNGYTGPVDCAAVTTMSPTTGPTLSPTISPSSAPTNVPTSAPRLSQTFRPSLSQTSSPTWHNLRDNDDILSPTISPSLSPTFNPTSLSPTFSSSPTSNKPLFDDDQLI